MKVESYERTINGRTVTCKGYERYVFYEIFFNTLGQRDRFLDLYDEDPNYKCIDAVHYGKKNKVGFFDDGQHRIYLDRIVVRSTAEMRDKMVSELMLTEWSKKEKVINHTELFRGGKYIRVYQV